ILPGPPSPSPTGRSERNWPLHRTSYRAVGRRSRPSHEVDLGSRTTGAGERTESLCDGRYPSDATPRDSFQLGPHASVRRLANHPRSSSGDRSGPGGLGRRGATGTTNQRRHLLLLDLIAGPYAGRCADPGSRPRGAQTFSSGVRTAWTGASLHCWDVRRRVLTLPFAAAEAVAVGNRDRAR